MKLLLILPFLALSAFAQNGNSYTCDGQGVCTETNQSIDSIKNIASGIGSSVKSGIQGGQEIGKGRTNNGACDAQGNCEVGEEGMLDALGLLGQTNSNLSGDAMEGISHSYTSQYSTNISCNYAKNYTFTAGFVIRVENCHLDSKNNVFKLDLKVCHDVLKKDACNSEVEEDWTAPVTFHKSSLEWVNNQTHTLDDKVSATVSCQPETRNCDLDITAVTVIEGNMAELGQQALQGTTDPNNYMSGQQFANRTSNDPVFQANLAGIGQDMADCANSNLFGHADEGYSLSCDGQHKVDSSATCTEVATCIDEQTTVISLAKQCETTVPTQTQLCDVKTPWGSCEVFLESHEQTCDTISPAGTCITELVNMIKTCEVHVPNGQCTNELEVDDKACTYSVPTGSCNVEALYDTETCSATIPEGQCNQSNAIVKTCQEDVSETKECALSVNNEQSECIASPVYDTVTCEHTKNVTETECTIERTATIVGESEGCSMTDEAIFDTDRAAIRIYNTKIHTCYNTGTPQLFHQKVVIGCDWAAATYWEINGECQSENEANGAPINAKRIVAGTESDVGWYDPEYWGPEYAGSGGEKHFIIPTTTPEGDQQDIFVRAARRNAGNGSIILAINASFGPEGLYKPDADYAYLTENDLDYGGSGQTIEWTETSTCPATN